MTQNVNGLGQFSKNTNELRKRDDVEINKDEEYWPHVKFLIFYPINFPFIDNLKTIKLA